MEIWRLLDSGNADGPTNMAIDEAILISHSQGQSPPTLRFYGWQPPCLSIGVFQSMLREVNLAECRSKGVDVVRRPTGGRAILHASEVTYSVVANADHPFVSGSISESYRRISAALATGLRLLGVNVQMAPKFSGARRPRSNVENADTGRIKTPACFDTPSDYELMVDGRKLVGSAQVRKHGGVLQHGSIMLDIDVASMLAMLQMSVFPEISCQGLAARMIGLKEVLGREVAYHEVTQSVVHGFQETVSLAFVPSDLADAERALARRLRDQKYLTDEWNFRR